MRKLDLYDGSENLQPSKVMYIQFSNLIFICMYLGLIQDLIRASKS